MINILGQTFETMEEVMEDHIILDDVVDSWEYIQNNLDQVELLDVIHHLIHDEYTIEEALEQVGIIEEYDDVYYIHVDRFDTALFWIGIKKI